MTRHSRHPRIEALIGYLRGLSSTELICISDDRWSRVESLVKVLSSEAEDGGRG